MFADPEVTPSSRIWHRVLNNYDPSREWRRSLISSLACDHLVDGPDRSDCVFAMGPTRPTEKCVPFAVSADIPRKLLRVTFRNVVSPDHMITELDRLATIIPTMGPGFTLLTDLTDLDSMDIDCVPHVTRMMDLCLAGGIRKVVRIIPNPDKDIGFGLLSLTHYRGKVPIATVETRLAAEQEITL